MSAYGVILLSLIACASNGRDKKEREPPGDAAPHHSSAVRDASLTPRADAAVEDARAPEDASQACLARSGRPGGCACTAKRDCAFECAIPSTDEHGVDLRCAEIREAVCSDFADPLGCHCVLGDDGGSAENMCWDWFF